MPNFKIQDENPNVTSGGGGCLCSEVGVADTAGPFAVFYGEVMEGHLSPTPVLCLHCAESFVMESEQYDD